MHVCKEKLPRIPWDWGRWTESGVILFQMSLDGEFNYVERFRQAKSGKWAFRPYLEKKSLTEHFRKYEFDYYAEAMAYVYRQ